MSGDYLNNNSKYVQHLRRQEEEQAQEQEQQGFNLINTITHDLLCLSIDRQAGRQAAKKAWARARTGQEKHIMKAESAA